MQMAAGESPPPFLWDIVKVLRQSREVGIKE